MLTYSVINCHLNIASFQRPNLVIARRKIAIVNSD